VHPLLARPARFVAYLIAWLAGGLLMAALLRALGPRPWPDAFVFAVPVTVGYGFVVLSAWWVCRSHPLPGASAGTALPAQLGAALQTQLGAALQTSAVWTAAGTIYAVALHAWGGLGPDRVGILRDAAVLFIAGIPLYLVSAALHYLFLAFEAAHAAERRVLESEVAAREAELRALRAQLNPHFLFNSLNSINALVGADPEAARRMCERLGDFLRRTLALGARDAVTLGEELALVDRYLDIEQVRFGSRLRVECELDPSASVCRVPPLLLQPLVENAIKHGVSAVEGRGRVGLRAALEGNWLAVEVTDNGPGFPAGAELGHGLRNIMERLNGYYGDSAQLQWQCGEGGTKVWLRIPCAS